MREQAWHWPGSDLFIPVLVAYFVVVYFVFTQFMRTRLPKPLPEEIGAA